MKNFKAKLLGVSLFVLTLAVVSCNHNFDKVVPTPPPFGQGAVYKTPKVLYIIADGARGTSVRDANIPNLTSLTSNAIYSWNSLSDSNQVDATNWADMITGVLPAKHNVLTENFAGNALATYQTIFQRIKSVRPNFRSAVFSASPAFKANLTTGADVSQGFTSDDAEASALATFIKTDTAQLVVGEFANIEAVGKATMFDNVKSPAYKTAIETFDTQVGTILTALKSRATYNSESWMIIVTSNRGGAFKLAAADDDKTVFSNTSQNTFTIIYAPTYNQTFIAKPFVGNSYSGNSIEFLGDPQRGIAQVSAQKSPAFNFGDTSGFSIEVKVKKHKNPVNVSRGDYYYQWPGFIGKHAQNGNNTPQTGWGGTDGAGWDFCLFQNGWRFFLSGVGGFGGGREIGGLNFTGDTWHDLLAVIEKRPDGSAVVRVYTDGVEGIGNSNGGNPGGAIGGAPLLGPYTLTTTGTDVDLDNNSVLRLGYTPGEMDGDTSPSTFGKIDVDLKELKIFRIALPDNVCTQYACDQSIDVSHPYFGYLIGYWPMDEGTGTTLADKGPVGADFTLSAAQSGGYKWNQFTNDLICSPAASDLSLLVPKNADLPTQILSWFNIPRQAAWALDGKVWISN